MLRNRQISGRTAGSDSRVHRGRVSVGKTVREHSPAGYSRLGEGASVSARSRWRPRIVCFVSRPGLGRRPTRHLAACSGSARSRPSVGQNPHEAQLVDLATGNPDPAFLPSIGHALRRVDPDARLYGGPLELPALVAFAAAEFAADGIATGPVAVTSGSLDALERLLREHARSGRSRGRRGSDVPRTARSAGLARSGTGAVQCRR